MEILEHSNNPEMEWPREWRAPCCGALLKIMPDDILTDRDYTGGFNGYFLNCPSCGGQPEVALVVKWDADRWVEQQRRLESSKAPYDENGYLMARSGQKFRQVGWMIEGGLNDGTIVTLQEDLTLLEKLKAPHGGYAPVYREV